MFKRVHHQHISALLGKFNAPLLAESEAFFAGGTALALLLDEYRESVDMDFICSSQNGYRILRNAVTSTLDKVLIEPTPHLREVRADRYGIRTVLMSENTPVKVEIVFEGRIQLQGEMNAALGVPVLSQQDMYCEKLLATADRGADRSTMHKDVIDLAMMIHHWGAIPGAAWQKAYAAYGKHVVHQFHLSVEQINDEGNLITCMDKLSMDKDWATPIVTHLNAAKEQLHCVSPNTPEGGKSGSEFTLR